jgi:hypothetical protein
MCKAIEKMAQLPREHYDKSALILRLGGESWRVDALFNCSFATKSTKATKL